MAAGAEVALFDVNGDALERAREDLAPDGDPLTETVDVTDPGGIAAAIASVAEHHGRLDFLVNNAGVRFVAEFLEYPLDEWNRTLGVNLTGAFLSAQAAIPHMLETGKGKLVNVGSVAGTMALRDRVAYSVSKAGLAMLTRSIAYELGGRAIYCNAILPGVIETPLQRANLQDPAMHELIRSNTPLARWGQPQEVAPAVAFLCGDDSDFIQGATLPVDGGWTIGKGY